MLYECPSSSQRRAMSDELRDDPRVLNTLPNAYSKLLAPVCSGHALFSPRETAAGGGAVGDVGEIFRGSFWKVRARVRGTVGRASQCRSRSNSMCSKILPTT